MAWISSFLSTIIAFSLFFFLATLTVGRCKRGSRPWCDPVGNDGFRRNFGYHIRRPAHSHILRSCGLLQVPTSKPTPNPPITPVPPTPPLTPSPITPTVLVANPVPWLGGDVPWFWSWSSGGGSPLGEILGVISGVLLTLTSGALVGYYWYVKKCRLIPIKMR